PPHPLRAVAVLSQIARQFRQKPLDPVLLNLLDRPLIYAGCPSVGFDLLPRRQQDVLAVHLVVQLMEPPRRTRLRGPIQRPLQLSRFLSGGCSLVGTHQRFPPPDAQTKYGAFPPPWFCCHGISSTMRRSDSRSALTHFTVIRL